MDNRKSLTILFLNEVVRTCNNSRQFAEYKLRYLSPCSPGSFEQIKEFEKMKQAAEYKISQAASCITWLTSLQEEEPKT